jgi:hypothetical protein
LGLPFGDDDSKKTLYKNHHSWLCRSIWASCLFVETVLVATSRLWALSIDRKLVHQKPAIVVLTLDSI